MSVSTNTRGLPGTISGAGDSASGGTWADARSGASAAERPNAAMPNHRAGPDLSAPAALLRVVIIRVPPSTREHSLTRLDQAIDRLELPTYRSLQASW